MLLLFSFVCFSFLSLANCIYFCVYVYVSLCDSSHVPPNTSGTERKMTSRSVFSSYPLRQGLSCLCYCASQDGPTALSPPHPTPTHPRGSSEVLPALSPFFSVAELKLPTLASSWVLGIQSPVLSLPWQVLSHLLWLYDPYFKFVLSLINYTPVAMFL